MKNLVFSIIITILSLSQISAQNYNFGKVSKEELQEKYYPQDSSAHAAILYRNETITFRYSDNNGFTQQREVHARIKIYDKEGFEWAQNKIYLYEGGSGSKEKLKGLKGYTFNLVNGKIEKDKLKSDAIFKEQVTEVINSHTFALPNVKAGSVIEYVYMEESPFVSIDDVSLQFTIPVKKLDAKIATPQFYRYNTLLNPKAYYSPELKKSKRNRKISNNQKMGLSGRNNGGGISVSTSERGSSTDYIDHIIEFNEENIPALSAESYSGSINNYKAKLSMEYEARLNLQGIVQKSYSTSWDRVSKTIYDSQNFGSQLTQTGFFKDDLNTLLEGVEDDFQKAFIVESLVKSKVKWNGMYGKYAQKGTRSAYKDGAGNVADINLLVVAMLRSQGVNANPVLVSTRNNGVPLFATLDGFNYVICVVQSDDKYLLVDATEPYSTGNVIPQRALNWQGRLILEGGRSQWINIKSNKKSVESTMLNVKVAEDFSLSGKVRKSYTAYKALNYRKKYTNLSKDDHIKSLESNKGGLEIIELTYDNDKDLSQPAKVSYDYELSDGIDEVGDKLYFAPLLFLATKDNPFKLEERLYPIDFVTPYEDKYLVNIMLPEGYTAESIPTTEALEFKDGDVRFEYIMQLNGKFLQLKVELQVNKPLIQPTDYADFKAFFSKIVEKQAEQIVLTKA